MPLDFDMNRVTPRMMMDFKEKTGRNILSLFGDNDELVIAELEPEVLTGVIWITLRVSGRDATWEDALDTPFAEIMGEADEDPTPASTST